MSTPTDLAVPRPPAPARHMPAASPLAHTTTYASWNAPHEASANTDTGVLLKPPLLDATLVAGIDPLASAPADLPVEPHPVDVRSPRRHRPKPPQPAVTRPWRTAVYAAAGTFAGGGALVIFLWLLTRS